MGRLCWGFRSGDRSQGAGGGLGKPSRGNPGEGGKWGREGLGFEGPSPLRAAGLGLGRDCKFSPSPPPPRRCGCNKRSPRLLPPLCPEGAAVRGGQHPSFLAPTPVGTCGCWEPRLDSPGVGQKRCPLGPGRCSQVGLEGQAVPRPQPALGPRVRVAGEWGDVNLGRIAEGVEGQSDPALKRA